LSTAIHIHAAQRLIRGERRRETSRRTRLELLILELLDENQRLRFKVAELEQQIRQQVPAKRNG